MGEIERGDRRLPDIGVDVAWQRAEPGIDGVDGLGHRREVATLDDFLDQPQLLLRGLGTTTLVADRLRGVTQDWVSRGRLDPQQASALVDEVMKALRGETPELEEQAERKLERNRDNLLQDIGVASQKEVDELRGRIDRLEQQLRQLNRVE